MMMNKGGMAGMMKQMQAMQAKMDKIQADLETKSFTFESGGGLVKVTANGKQRVTSIKIDPQLIADNDLEMMEDLIVAAVNKAVDETGKISQEEMKKAYSGMLPNIPGMDKLF
ncbi:MAG: YbaB/EbfC family nucleoid-associated protein [Bacteroidetes bacterium]|nr:YbaB/EbfC family nucleoid-associated protein [Bacteroidota bacterium]